MVLGSRNLRHKLRWEMFHLLLLLQSRVKMHTYSITGLMWPCLLAENGMIASILLQHWKCVCVSIHIYIKNVCVHIVIYMYVAL